MSIVDPTYHITLLRHAESTGNAEKLLQGQMDYPLSERGRAQAAALAQRWQAEGVAFDRVVASPLLRARETAEIILATLPAPLEFDPLWMERNNGKMAGLREEEVRALHKEEDFTTPYRAVGETGESEWELYLRAGQALVNLMHHPPGKYLIVSHGGTLNMTLYAILGITPSPNFQGPRFRFQNTTFAQLRYDPMKHRWRVEVIGDRVHWKE
jgi:broad specificity phosphatase PhoE